MSSFGAGERDVAEADEARSPTTNRSAAAAAAAAAAAPRGRSIFASRLFARRGVCLAPPSPSPPRAGSSAPRGRRRAASTRAQYSASARSRSARRRASSGVSSVWRRGVGVDGDARAGGGGVGDGRTRRRPGRPRAASRSRTGARGPRVADPSRAVPPGPGRHAPRGRTPRAAPVARSYRRSATRQTEEHAKAAWTSSEYAATPCTASVPSSASPGIGTAGSHGAGGPGARRRTRRGRGTGEPCASYSVAWARRLAAPQAQPPSARARYRPTPPRGPDALCFERVTRFARAPWSAVGRTPHALSDHRGGVGVVLVPHCRTDPLAVIGWVALRVRARYRSREGGDSHSSSPRASGASARATLLASALPRRRAT